MDGLQGADAASPAVESSPRASAKQDETAMNDT